MMAPVSSSWVLLLFLCWLCHFPRCKSFALYKEGVSGRGSRLHQTTSPESLLDTRPHEQRANGPRLARRMNHGFRYLYRQPKDPKIQSMTSFEYLAQYYSEEKILQMNASFPPLLGLNASRHLHPKIRFLKETMGLTDLSTSECNIPPQYFGARLERTVAPRHAFLMYKGLPHGKELFQDPNRWQDFLVSCRTTKRFCALCNQWRDKAKDSMITAQQIEAFDALFARGALAAARNELCQLNNTWPLQHINISSAEILDLLIKHGANPFERDNKGVSLLHWAAATNLENTRFLLEFFPKKAFELTERDGATPLHWAVAGSRAKEFGTGGHVDICYYLLSSCEDPKKLVNQLTYDGNSPLMWASWSGSLDTVKLMVRHRADFRVANRNGCTCAHWAASGGSLAVCRYLQDTVGVDFYQPNHGGNTPLTHAVAFGRVEIVKWLREQAGDSEDEIAASLAEDFCNWTDGDTKRQKVLQLFRDDYWDASETSEASEGSDYDDEDL